MTTPTTQRSEKMSTLGELYEKLKEAEFDVSRAKAKLATNEQRFRMGFGADRSVLFSDNLRLECAITEVARTERIIASFKHKKADAKADGIKAARSPEAIELAKIKLEERRIIESGAIAAREAKAERQRVAFELRGEIQKLIIEKMRNIVGEDAFLEICKQANDESETVK